MNDHQVHKLSGKDTQGALSIWMGTIAPGEGPPPHTHELEDEIFHVLEGEFIFTNDGFDCAAGPGTLLYLPRGQAHGFRNTGSGIGRVLVIATPSGLEDYFERSCYPDDGSGTRPPPTEGELNRFLQLAPDCGLKFPSLH